MVPYRIVERPAFIVAGKSTFISGPDSDLFGTFWQQSRKDGTLQRLSQVAGYQRGAQTGGYVMGVSRVEKDPSNRSFHFLIACEPVEDADLAGLEVISLPASTWAVFEARGPVPQALIEAEIYCFSEWLPNSTYTHAAAPEMEVYGDDPNTPPSPDYCEFWLPITPRATTPPGSA